VTQAALLAAAGMAPDLDLLWGRHRQETHSIGAAALFALLAWYRRWPISPDAVRLWTAAFAAWASHPVLDALAADLTPPGGVMMFWPFSAAYFHAGWDVFDGISRRWWTPGFLAQNARAVVREIAVLTPLVVLVFWWRSASRQRRDGVGAAHQ
jgi:membrane-bound metal-dependent hydrolase YbcI (DUF457 family)